jgi:ankyrin repeat protein
MRVLSGRPTIAVRRLLLAVLLGSAAIGTFSGCDLGPGEPHPLLHAVSVGDIDEVRKRLDRGADPNKTYDGFALLTAAAANGDGPMVRLLLERGADPNKRDSDNWTPLMQLALNTDAVEVAETLISKGADPCIRQSGKDVPGATAFEIANAKQHVRLAERLGELTRTCGP